MDSACNVLCLNHGSSSLKFALYDMQRGDELRVAEGAAEGIGLPTRRFWLRGSKGETLIDRSVESGTLEAAVAAMSQALGEHGFRRFSAVGHRVLHGGPDYMSPQKVTPQLILALSRCVPFAPLHLPGQLEVIRTITTHYPDLPQVACFDTAFHRRIPEVAQRFSMPRFLWDEGIRRYGFHGLSFEFIVASLPPEAGSRMIIAHLGNGASMAAVLKGVPADTTMGLTPTGGMMMGTRSGDLDPGVLLYLMRQKHYDAAVLERMVDTESGLLGVSGLSSDMRTLLESSGTHPHAAQAVEMFSYQARKCIGALSAVLGGLDTLVFTGGIGEHASFVRSEICKGLKHLGIELNDERNSRHESIISVSGSPCTVRVIRTNEDLMIARHTRNVLESERPP
ncbi:MAG: acetate/propionate family kinase [Acidobacteria bacterium]|nr:MAG: acetate/propionate family kinase [Acidobacteriota bacterium]